ncbi:hypothetical protein [Streptomyces cacaoi]|uniref:hypothetical protein n=1 Tax=Streptomyces cacaoi TaxID=1898 RepID=UPI002634AE4E|nr:hypothetical protein [Streptomyces cacaoi]
MAGIFTRLTSPLRGLGDPDGLVLDAHRLLRVAEKNDGDWSLMTAYSGVASAKVQLALYLREYRD